MKCPRCGNKLYVVKTTKINGKYIIRSRKCPKCGFKATTSEELDGDMFFKPTKAPSISY